MTMERTNSLGFYDLMNIAEQNTEQTERMARTHKYLSYAPGPTKKPEDPKKKKLSENVQKFLAKQEEEVRKQEEEARQRKEKLLELRSRDKKAKKRVGQMLRMTKSANKSVLDDAKHCLSDSLADQGDFQQCDEDDYGYVSQYAAEFHKKMLEKYKAIPKSKPVPRPEQHALPVPEIKALKNSKTGNQSKSTLVTSPEPIDEPKEKRKKPQPPPPPFNFSELMQLAAEKLKEPPIILKPEPLEKEVFEFGRPMTAKEKAQYLQEKAVRERINNPAKEFTTSNGGGSNKTPAPSQAKGSSSFKIPSKHSKESSSSSPNTKAPILKQQLLKSSGNSERTHQSSNQEKSKKIESLNGVTSNSNSHVGGDLSKSKINPSKPGSSMKPPPRPDPPKPSSKIVKPDRSKVPQSESIKIKQEPEEPYRPPVKSKGSNSTNKPMTMTKPSLPVPKGQLHKVSKISEPKPGLKYKAVSQLPKRPEPRKLPQPDPYSRPPAKRKPTGGRQIIGSDDEDEYDSEMDDFIDYSDQEPASISDMIRQITGYDKRRYVNDGESEDEAMESSAWEQMKEEHRSLRIGIKEDLEDMQKELEEKKRKALLAKKRKVVGRK